jgi:hypothetical protein
LQSNGSSPRFLIHLDSRFRSCGGLTVRPGPSELSISGQGAAQLRAQWRDPDFDPDQRAFYYARGCSQLALQI